MADTALTPEEITQRIVDIPLWTVSDDTQHILREFVFSNFEEALSFVNMVGGLAEEANHHPDIFLHDYKKVSVELTTHSLGGLSPKDFVLAAKIDVLV